MTAQIIYYTQSTKTRKRKKKQLLVGLHLTGPPSISIGLHWTMPCELTPLEKVSYKAHIWLLQLFLSRPSSRPSRSLNTVNQSRNSREYNTSEAALN